MRGALALTLLGLTAPTILIAAPRGVEQRPDPRQAGSAPAHIQRVESAAVGIRVEVPRDRPSAATLGAERWGSGVIFDAGGYALTVSYVLLDAERIEVTLRDGRKVPGGLVGLDLEVGLGVVRLQGAGPWPAAALGDSTRVAVGDRTGTIGMEEDGDLVSTQGRVEAIRPYTAPWEYALDRAFIVSPHNRAFGGAAVVDGSGAVIGISSLRLGERPFVSLAIPIEKFLPGKDELIAKGRVESRRPRPWLGLLTVPAEEGGVAVAGVSPFGPAGTAGFRRGDVIVTLNGEKIATQEEFYARLWAGRVDEDLRVVIRREGRFEAITVRSADRYRFYRTTEK